ncbi:hypothetical protein EV702DRAFT_1250552 [Suillus placidus]|uniref:Uncharacterized protein n=1 Tax=Suillus placidus TaxID=48579 RepID=A0A9P7A3D9_9AGAM|nr:hypothetical protein EV702DRAFT_1250552 [Suillus placidus]
MQVNPHIEIEGNKEFVLLGNIALRLGTRYHPFLMLPHGNVSLICCALSDIGFVGIGYIDGSVAVIDLRGPSLLRPQRQKRQSKLLVRNQDADPVVSLTWTISAVSMASCYDNPLVDLTSFHRKIPPYPQPVSVGPPSLLGSWFQYGKPIMTGEQLDVLFAGPDRPISPLNLAQTLQDTTSNDRSGVMKTMENTRNGVYDHLNDALAERGEMLGNIEQQIDSLQQGSKDMVAQDTGGFFVAVLERKPRQSSHASVAVKRDAEEAEITVPEAKKAKLDLGGLPEPQQSPSFPPTPMSEDDSSRPLISDALEADVQAASDTKKLQSREMPYTFLESNDPTLISCILLKVALAGLVEAWIVCATDPHDTTPPHDILWSQVTSWGWGAEVLQLRQGITEGEGEVCAAIWGASSAWLEGAWVNGIRGGEGERAKTLETIHDGFIKGVEHNCIGMHARMLSSVVCLWLACMSIANTDADIAAPLSTPPLTLPFAELSSFSAHVVSHSLWLLVTRGVEQAAYNHLATFLAYFHILSRHIPGTSPDLWVAQGVTILERQLPGEEERTFCMLKAILAILTPQFLGAMAPPGIWEKGRCSILKPFLDYAIRLNQEVYIAPSDVTPGSIMWCTTLRLPSSSSSSSPFTLSAASALLPFSTLPDIDLDQASLPFLGSGIPFYQFYTDFLALYDAISFSHPIFASLLLPPLALTYPIDYRWILWADVAHVLRTARAPVDQIIARDLRDFLYLVERGEMIGKYVGPLLQGSVDGFLRLVVVHHVARNIWPFTIRLLFDYILHTSCSLQAYLNIM